MSEAGRPWVELPGGGVFITGPALAFTARAVRAQIRAAALDGIAPPPMLREYLQALIHQAASVAGSAEVPADAAVSPSARVGPIAAPQDAPPSHLVGAGSAAAYLEITTRGVRDLCSRGALQATRVAGCWVIDWADLEEYAERRSARRVGRSHDGEAEDR
ncbi:helix-turn-helix domain-containing protein [Streptosporangium sp. DT93]|uniref:helix-turn-helix domain-containing protein n=1 Tax=Streptosporangium sp. DT93 TaxID=3393428 RepID=UPI003CF596E4